MRRLLDLDPRSARSTSWATLAALAAVLIAAPTADAAASCDDPSHLCIVTGDDGAKWEPGMESSSKNRARRSTKQGGKLSVDLDDGRASLFVNGRFRGNVPLEDIKVPSGKNDIQVRDGETILAEGLLTVPRNGSVSVLVHYAD